MASEQFNNQVDWAGLKTLSSNNIECIDGKANRTKQMSSGLSTFGDTCVIDTHSEGATPDATYEVKGDINDTMFTDLGGSLISNATGFTNPLCVGSLSFSTGGGAPTLTNNLTMVQVGATRLRKYSPIPFKISTRSRAQNCICTKAGSVYTPIIQVKKGQTVADEVNDYSWQSVSGDIMPIDIEVRYPKGVLASYDLKGGVPTISYSFNWYATGTPTIELTAAAIAAGWEISSPSSEEYPKDGYTKYSFTAACKYTGEEYTAPANNG